MLGACTLYGLDAVTCFRNRGDTERDITGPRRGSIAEVSRDIPLVSVTIRRVGRGAMND